MLISVK